MAEDGAKGAGGGGSVSVAPETLQLIVDAATDGIAIVCAGRIRYANRRLAEMTGYDLPFLLGSDFEPFLAPEKREQARTLHRRRLAGESVPTLYETILLRADGDPMDVELHVTRIRYEEEPAALVFIRDIRPRREALRESRRRLQSLLDATTDVAALLEPDGTVIACNQGFAATFGQRRDALEGRNVFPLIPASRREKRRGEFRRMVEDPRPLRFLDRLDPRHVYDTRFYPIFSDAGTLAGIALFAEECEERIRMEEDLRTFKTLADEATYGLVVADPEYSFTYVNRAFAAMYGWSPEELVGKNYRCLVSEVEAEAIRGYIAQMEAGETLTPKEVEGRRRDGTVFPCLMTAVAIRDGGEAIRLFAAITVDISERKRLEERLRHAETMQVIGRLAGGVAHDFNNQLVAMLGYADLLRNELTHPRLQGYAEMIYTSAQHSTELTRQLLAFSRKGRLTSEPVDLHGLIHQVVRLLERSSEQRIEVRSDLRASAAVTRGDPAQLQSALLNMVLNARDAMPEGGLLRIRTDEVRIETEDAEGAEGPEVKPGTYVRLVVTDTGCGMDAETRRHAFDPFFTTKPIGKGTGMGLAAVYGTIKAHGGDIALESEPGRGTTLRIFLPLAAEGSDDGDAPASLPPAPRTPARLLVVETEAAREILCEVLKRHGYEVTAFSDREKAAAWLARPDAAADLVLLDEGRGRPEGSEPWADFRKIRPGIPVAMLTAYGDDETDPAGGESPVTRIRKPFTQAILLARVAEILDEARR